MKNRFCVKAISASLVLVLSAGASLSQSVGEQDSLGLVLPSKPKPSAEMVQAPSAYSQFIDPVNGLTADDLVRYALTHNGELAAARQMITEVRGRLRQAGARPNPMVEASGSQAVTTADNNLELGAELPLELGGRRKARIAVAEREVELRESEVADFERKLAAEVRMRYSDAVAAARNLKFTEDLLTLTRDSHRLVQARVEKGKTAPLEQNMVFVEVNRVDAMRVNFEGKIEVAIFDLKKTVGMSPGEALRLRGEFSIDQQPPQQSEALRNALTTRPDLTAAKAAENLAQAQIEQVRIEGKVDASIFASYMRQNMGYDVRGFNSAGVLAPVQGVFHYLTFGVRLTLPVRNKNQGNIEAAVATLEAARERRQFAEIVVRNEVAAAYARFERAQVSLAIYRDAVRAQALRNLDVIQQTYTLGQKSLLEYIGEQRRYIDIETSYTDVLKEYFNSLVEIERAAGVPIPSA